MNEAVGLRVQGDMNEAVGLGIRADTDETVGLGGHDGMNWLGGMGCR